MKIVAIEDEVWHAHFARSGEPFVVVDPKRPRVTAIADVDSCTDDDGKARAYVLAAAPELLKALIATHDALKMVSNELVAKLLEDGRTSLTKQQYDTVRDLLRDIPQVIKKAKGQRDGDR